MTIRIEKRKPCGAVRGRWRADVLGFDEWGDWFAVHDGGVLLLPLADPWAAWFATDGSVTAAANPNGSQRNIAGVYNETKTVLGLMPHPERLSDPKLGGNDGRPFFDGLVEALS